MSSCGLWGVTIGIATVVVASAACATGDDASGAYIAGETSAEGGNSDVDGSSSQNLTVDASQPNNTTKDSGGGGGNTDAEAATDSGPTGTCTPAIVINELQSTGTTASDEFVELYNGATCSVSLSGYKLGYYSAAGVGGSGGAPLIYFTGSSSDTIPSKGFFVIGGSGFTGKSDGTLTGGLKDDAGQVGIADGTGKLLDSVGYGTGTTGPYVEKSPAPVPPTSKSIGRKPDGTDTNNNSVDFTVLTAPSPGAAN